MDRRQFLTGMAAVTAAAALPAVAAAAAYVAAPVAKAAPKTEWLPILDSTGKVCARAALEALAKGGKAWDPQRGVVEPVNGHVVLQGGQYVVRNGGLDLDFESHKVWMEFRDLKLSFPDPIEANKGAYVRVSGWGGEPGPEVVMRNVTSASPRFAQVSPFNAASDTAIRLPA